MKNIIKKLKERATELHVEQLVAIKNSKISGQLVPGVNAVLVNGNLAGFLWTVEETTHNRYGGKNAWDVVYSAMFPEYEFQKENKEGLNLLYLKEGETLLTINFGRRNGQDYKYVLIDNWGRPIEFKLVQIPTEYEPIIYSIRPELILHNWDGKTIYRDIMVPKKVLYPYSNNNDWVLCCTYDPKLGYLSAHWDGEMVRWEKNQQPIHKVSWCFIPKSKKELIDKINSKEETVEEPIEEEYTSSNEEIPERRRRRPRRN